jgi:hypothetical protein
MADWRLIKPNHPGGSIMAKRKKGSKVQSRAKLRRANSARRGKARKVAKAAKRTAARAKPKPAPVKKAARKVKQPVAPVVETAVVEVIEQPAPGVIAVSEVEETEVRKASWQYLCDLSATLGKNYAFPSWDLGRTMLALRFEAAMTFRNFSPGGWVLPGDIFMIRRSNEGLSRPH